MGTLWVSWGLGWAFSLSDSSGFAVIFGFGYLSGVDLIGGVWGFIFML